MRAEGTFVQTQECPQLRQRCTLGGRAGFAIHQAAADRLPHKTERYQDEYPDRADSKESCLPRGDLSEKRQDRWRHLRNQLDHQPTDHKRKPGPDILRTGINAKRTGQTTPREIIADHRCGRRAKSRFPHTHGYTGEKQLEKIAREAAAHRRKAPKHDADHNDALAIGAIRQPPDNETKHDIKKNEGKPGQQADLCIAETEVFLYRRKKECRDKPFDIRHHIGERQRRNDEPGVNCAWIFLYRNARTIVQPHFRHILHGFR